MRFHLFARKLKIYLLRIWNAVKVMLLEASQGIAMAARLTNGVFEGIWANVGPIQNNLGI